VAEAPWKANIRRGKAGYRLIETVYSTGDPVEDDRLLRRAEAYWIDRLRPIHNVVRPIRPPGRPAPRAPRSARTARPAQPAKRRRRQVKPYFLAAFVLTFTYLAARLVVAMDLPWPAAPWVAAPVLGVLLGWATFWRLHRAVRKVLR
jgi:AcrR family transcriptional regulator